MYFLIKEYVSHLMTPGDNWAANQDGARLKEVGHVMLPNILKEDRLSRIMREVTKETPPLCRD
jgi:hypothetical protein